jgi:hypothetical protein
MALRVGRAVEAFGRQVEAHHRHRYSALAIAGFCILVGGAVAWGLKPRHWAPKLTASVGATALLVGLCCARHLRQRPLSEREGGQRLGNGPARADSSRNSRRQQQKGDRSGGQPVEQQANPNGPSAIVAGGMTLAQIMKLDENRFKLLAIDVLMNEQEDGARIYSHMMTGRQVIRTSRDPWEHQELQMAVQLIELHMAQSKGRPSERLIQQLATHVAGCYANRADSPILARGLFMDGLSQFNSDGRVPVGAERIWSALPDELPKNGEPKLTADWLHGLIRRLQAEARSRSQLSLWKQGVIVPYILQWALCVGDDSVSKEAAAYLADWSNRPTAIALHQPVIERGIKIPPLQTEDELRRRLVPFKAHWAAKVRNEEVRSLLLNRVA